MPTTTIDDRAGLETGGLGLPVSKLRGLAPRVRAALKRHRVATCGQLLRAAGGDRTGTGSRAWPGSTPGSCSRWSAGPT